MGRLLLAARFAQCLKLKLFYGTPPPAEPVVSVTNEQTTYTFNVGDPEFHEIMEVLKRYSYHISIGTISNRIKNTAHIEDNHAGYWLNIYMYTEPNRYGELYSISSGGTGEFIFDHGVYRMGYWGNKIHLKFMEEICQVVDSNWTVDVRKPAK